MRYVEVAAGAGAAAEPGQVYAVHYTGWLRDGTKFDSSRDRGEPIKFEQGKRRVIAGWDAGFEGMRVGGRRRLFIPYQLAYGVKGRPPRIPPRAELIFDVELVGVEAAPADTTRRP
jgi:peptidylprolyl isomerase